MRCGQVDRYVERFVDGALEAVRARRIEGHLRFCTRCTARVEAARALLRGFRAHLDRAPPGFAERVMGVVYREALAGGRQPDASKSRPARPARVPARTYRRLGLSFLLTAGVLAASLLVPHAAYPGLLGTGSEAAGLSRESSAVVRGVLSGADSAVRGILREQANGGSKR